MRLSRFPDTSAFSPGMCIPFPKEPTRAQVFDPDSDWRDAIMRRLSVLCSLDRGWDGYGAAPVSFHNAHFALQVLEKVSAFCGPQPSIIPGISGDLQIEWHTRKGDIELHIKAPYDVTAWYATPDGAEATAELSSNFIDVSRWVTSLGVSRSASHSAAA